MDLLSDPVTIGRAFDRSYIDPHQPLPICALPSQSLVRHIEQTHPLIKVNVEEQLAYYKGIQERVVGLTGDTIEFTNSAFDVGKKILVEGQGKSWMTSPPLTLACRGCRSLTCLSPAGWS